MNGHYAGHRPHQLWWRGSHRGLHAVDLDVAHLLKPGQRNMVAIRVWNNAEIGGLYRRGFIYSPNGTGE